MNACQSILQVIMIDFIIANNNKQTENFFFSRCYPHKYIFPTRKPSATITATAKISAYQLMPPSAILGRNVTYPV